MIHMQMLPNMLNFNINNKNKNQVNMIYMKIPQIINLKKVKIS